MGRTIKINSQARMAVAPDSIRIMAMVKYLSKEYQDAVCYAAKAQAEMAAITEKAGLAASDLKTVSWDIVAEYQYRVSNRNEQIREFAGYRYTHSFVLELGIDHKTVGRILGEMARSSLTPEISLQYDISKVEKYKDRLLEQAVADARRKAEVIAQAGGVKLGQIVSMIYADRGAEFLRGMENQIAVPEMMKAQDFSVPDVAPADMELSETVAVEWELL